mgnify:CR=1 FL=1
MAEVGQRVGDDVLSPGWTDYNDTALYETRDLTSLLHEGKNAVGLTLGLKFEQIAAALASFRGADRRLDVKFEDGNYLVVDDYAHHPTELRATLEAPETPIRGASPVKSVSGGSSFLTTSVPRASASSAIAPPATALPCITVSGMSFGPW